MRAFRSSRALAAPAKLIATGMALASCQPAETDNANGNNAAQEPAVKRPATETPITPADREVLLLAVAKAASAHASGLDDSAEQRELDGKPFEFTIRFGCSGASKDLRSTTVGWSYQPESETLRLRATPSITAIDPVAAKIGGEAVEAVEGFWVPLPWVLQAACPPTETQLLAAAEPASKVNQTAEDAVQPSLRWPKIGIAQFFIRGDARTRRRDRRAYETVRTVEQGSSVGSQGFNLILAGRLRPMPGKRVIECVAAAINTPPDCIVSADIDEVRMEKPEDGNVLARWSS